MKKLLLIIICFLCILSPVYATTLTFSTVFGPTDTVTNVKLNGNNTSISNVVNGNLDNTNANTTNGYRFPQSIGTLPTAGTQGAMFFLTSDNTWNVDTGSAFVKAANINSGSATAGQAVCWKTATTLGKCTSVVASDGSCTCS